MAQKQVSALARYARVRALIMKIVKARPGLTYVGVKKQFLLSYGFLPEIGRRIRELRTIGWVNTVPEGDGRLHVYPNDEKVNRK